MVTPITAMGRGTTADTDGPSEAFEAEWDAEETAGEAESRKEEEEEEGGGTGPDIITTLQPSTDGLTNQPAAARCLSR